MLSAELAHRVIKVNIWNSCTSLTGMLYWHLKSTELNDDCKKKKKMNK